MRSRRGFTLVELLVVLGIIAVLTAIFLPVLGRARASARTAVCVTQISQLCKAARLYAEDNDRTLVPARTAVASTGTKGITWCVLLQPYLQSEKILICPDDPAPQASDQSTCLPHSYGINYSLAYNTALGSYPFTLSLGQVSRVSDLILFFELKGAVAQMGSGYYANGLSRVDFRHHQVGNFAFLDGHVKGLRADAVKNPLYWDPYVG
jgi:prepilin-type N-terminal cleavage/methylation domain-containing protein/prepilin-type processing-associated H-X9-DG protein